MEVLFASSEVSPFSKVGGLGDVAGSLPAELAHKGIKINVISPLYSTVDVEKFGIRFTNISGHVILGKRSYSYKIAKIPQNTTAPLTFLFVYNKKFYHRTGIYTKPNGEGFPDNNARFFFFQKVIVELIAKRFVQPDIVHVNDHHTALIPFLIQNRGIHLPVLFTVHNFQYQGNFSRKDLLLLDKEDVEKIQRCYKSKRNSYNALEIGLKSADWINTVSVTYADELSEMKELSFGLYRIVKSIKNKFSGIMNGVDYSIWNPEFDPYLDVHFSPENLEGKLRNKKYLKEMVGLPDNLDAPLIGSISRLVESKGFDLILDIINKLVSMKLQLIFLGMGSQKIKTALQSVATRYPNHISFHSEFNEKLAHLIEAGSDIFLMPSRFEPCGLNQIYSLKYGTIPIVYKTGGLADTICDWNGHQGNGFVFEKYQSEDLLATIKRAIKTYGNKSQWTKIMMNAMEEDFSWSRSAGEYVQLYEKLLGRRKMPSFGKMASFKR